MIHAVGTLGLLMLLGAYFLISTGRLSAASPRYQGMNLVGAIALLVYSYVLGAWASVALNVIWGGIAVAALARLTRRRAG